MKDIFLGCKDVIALIDISKLYTNNVNDMNRRLYHFYLLISLIDISNWNTDSVNDISLLSLIT